jgi:hypothetical protein
LVAVALWVRPESDSEPEAATVPAGEEQVPPVQQALRSPMLKLKHSVEQIPDRLTR